jgi:hypothetical protein
MWARNGPADEPGNETTKMVPTRCARLSRAGDRHER